MKKDLIICMALFLGAGLVSCEDKVEEGMTQNEQKNYLEEVAIDFTKKVPSSDFESLRDFVMSVGAIYEDISWSQVGEWADSASERSRVYVDSYMEADTDTYSYGGSISQYIDVEYFDVYDFTLVLSNFTGHFTAQEDTLHNQMWVYEPAQDLQFLFKDADENDCVLKLSKEGKETMIRLVSSVYEMDDEWDGGYDSITGNYKSVEEYYLMKLRYSMYVPETVTLSLTKAGSNVAKATLTTSLSGLTKDGYFDAGNSNLNAKVVFELNNGYKLTGNASSTSNKKLSYTWSAANNSGELISYTMSCDPTGIPSIVLNDDLDVEEVASQFEEDKDENLKNLYLSLSVLGKVQLTGKISDLKTFIELVDSVNHLNEDNYERLAKEMSSKLDIGLYYKGSSKKEASLIYEILYETWQDVDRYGQPMTWHRYKPVPILEFADGSKVKAEDFFDEKNFEKAIKAFEALEEEYDLFLNGEDEESLQD